MIEERYIIQLLSKKHQRNDFDCGVPVLNDFLQKYARQQSEIGVNKTYVATTSNLTSVLGFYSICAGSISFQEAPQILKKKLPRYPIPIARIGRLAVNIKQQGVGLGGYLLMDALQRSVRIAVGFGLVAIVVDVKDDKAAEFYKRYDFERFNADSNSLYLPIKTLQKM